MRTREEVEREEVIANFRGFWHGHIPIEEVQRKEQRLRELRSKGVVDNEEFKKLFEIMYKDAESYLTSEEKRYNKYTDEEGGDIHPDYYLGWLNGLLWYLQGDAEEVDKEMRAEKEVKEEVKKHIELVRGEINNPEVIGKGYEEKDTGLNVDYYSGWHEALEYVLGKLE